MRLEHHLVGGYVRYISPHIIIIIIIISLMSKEVSVTVWGNTMYVGWISAITKWDCGSGHRQEKELSKTNEENQCMYCIIVHCE